MFRMRAAGYHGPDIFSPAAINLISKASNGLMRRVNILADKSLLAAFVENTHRIESRHVLAAIRDSELTPDEPWLNRKKIAIVAGATLSALALAGAGWMLGKNDNSQRTLENTSPIAVTQPTTQAPSIAIASPAITPPVQSTVVATTPAPTIAPNPAPVATKTPEKPVVTAANTNAGNKNMAIPASLLQQRMDAAKDMLIHVNKSSVSIQLFHTQDTRPMRMEGFLSRAKNLGVLSDIYIVPIKINGRAAFRILYGIYPDNAAALIGIQNLPQRYKDAFAPSVDSLSGY